MQSNTNKIFDFSKCILQNNISYYFSVLNSKNTELKKQIQHFPKESSVQMIFLEGSVQMIFPLIFSLTLDMSGKLQRSNSPSFQSFSNSFDKFTGLWNDERHSRKIEAYWVSLRIEFFLWKLDFPINLDPRNFVKSYSTIRKPCTKSCNQKKQCFRVS